MFDDGSVCYSSETPASAGSTSVETTCTTQTRSCPYGSYLVVTTRAHRHVRIRLHTYPHSGCRWHRLLCFRLGLDVSVGRKAYTRTDPPATAHARVPTRSCAPPHCLRVQTDSHLKWRWAVEQCYCKHSGTISTTHMH